MSSTFDNLIVSQCGSLLISVIWNSLILDVCFFPRLKKFSLIISLNKLSAPFSLFCFWNHRSSRRKDQWTHRQGSGIHSQCLISPFSFFSISPLIKWILLPCLSSLIYSSTWSTWTPLLILFLVQLLYYLTLWFLFGTF